MEKWANEEKDSSVENEMPRFTTLVSSHFNSTRITVAHCIGSSTMSNDKSSVFRNFKQQLYIEGCDDAVATWRATR